MVDGHQDHHQAAEPVHREQPGPLHRNGPNCSHHTRRDVHPTSRGVPGGTGTLPSVHGQATCCVRGDPELYRSARGWTRWSATIPPAPSQG